MVITFSTVALMDRIPEDKTEASITKQRTTAASAV
jgi:hypothetical protein